MSASSKTYYKSTAGSVAVDSLTKQVLTVANQLLSLPQFGGETEPMTATQGSFRPYTSYSGATHTGCAAVDLTAYNWENRLIVLDLLGMIYCHRLVSEGDWPEHGHAMLNGMGCASAALKGQIAELKRGGDGLAGDRPDRDRELRSLLWPLAVYNGRTGKLKATAKTNLRTGPSYERDIIRSAPVDTVVNAIMEVNVGGDRWFVTDKGEWGFSGKWAKIPFYATTPSQVPAQVLDLTNFKWTGPIGSNGKPLEVKQTALATYQHVKHFFVSGGGVVFNAPTNGYTTTNSSYPRSELREMAARGTKLASWSNRSGVHEMRILQAVTKLPKGKPHVVCGQIHDAEDDIVMVRLEGRRLFVESNGKEVGLLDANYVLKTKFHLRIAASSGGIRVAYNGNKAVVDLPKKVGSGWYFKAGCYTQASSKVSSSSPKYGTGEGEVIIYSLQVTHR